MSRMSVRAGVLVSGTAMLALLLLCGAALAARIYSDPAGDATLGPDVRSVTVSNTSTDVTFRIRFATAPALRVSQRGRWIDMLLIGIDVPPLGPRPIPDGDWLGANFAAGFHGPANDRDARAAREGIAEGGRTFPGGHPGHDGDVLAPPAGPWLPDLVRVRDGRGARVERRERGASGGKAGLRPGPRHVPLHPCELTEASDGSSGTSADRLVTRSHLRRDRLHVGPP